MPNIKYTCPVCSQEFTSLEEYSKHVQNHVNEERKIKEERERKRKQEEKEIDKKRVEEARKLTVETFNAYCKIVEEYEKKYDEYPVYRYITPNSNNIDDIIERFFM